MTQVRDVMKTLAEHTRPESAASWDPVGLQLGDPDASIKRMGVCHEVTEGVVESLERTSVDLLVTYHPLLFEPTNRLLVGRSAEARAYRLVSLGVNLLVTHTDFDAAPGGAADALASALRLGKTEPFGGDPDNDLLDIGRLGEFDDTLAALEVVVSQAFGHAGMRITGDRSSHVSLVAVVPGSGSDFIPAAAERADALVTGDVSHHRAVRAADLGLAIVDPGHIATERPGMTALANLVAKVSDVEVIDLTTLDPQTWS